MAISGARRPFRYAAALMAAARRLERQDFERVFAAGNNEPLPLKDDLAGFSLGSRRRPPGRRGFAPACRQRSSRLVAMAT